MAVKRARKTAKRAPARKAAKRTTARKAVKRTRLEGRRAPARKAAKRTTKKRATAKKATKRAPARKAAKRTRKVAKKRAPAKKATKKRAPARKAAKRTTKKRAVKKAAKKRAPARKAAKKRAPARKAAKKRAPARKAAKRRPAKKAAASPKRTALVGSRVGPRFAGGPQVDETPSGRVSRRSDRSPGLMARYGDDRDSTEEGSCGAPLSWFVYPEAITARRRRRSQAGGDVAGHVDVPGELGVPHHPPRQAETSCLGPVAGEGPRPVVEPEPRSGRDAHHVGAVVAAIGDQGHAAEPGQPGHVVGEGQIGVGHEHLGCPGGPEPLDAGLHGSVEPTPGFGEHHRTVALRPPRHLVVVAHHRHGERARRRRAPAPP